MVSLRKEASSGHIDMVIYIHIYYIELVRWEGYKEKSFSFKLNIRPFKLKIHHVGVDLRC